MVQLLLPIFPSDMSLINNRLGFQKSNGVVYYFLGMMPVYQHKEGDPASFRLVAAQIVDTGNATQAELVRAFGISENSMKRWIKRYRAKGAKGFFEKRRTRGERVLTPEVVVKVQEKLNNDQTVSLIASELGLKNDTVHKAIRDGRLIKQKKKTENPANPSTESDRSREDSQAVMGTGCTRPDDRLAASLGVMKEAPVTFQTLLDVRFGGVLSAMPALLANGLLKHTASLFSLPKGFYGLIHLFIMVAFMALCRIKNPEGLRHHPPGDFGKLLGLDRVPEVRTLREKLDYLATHGDVGEWSVALSRDWMAKDPDLAGYLYVDGHVRVYHGRQAKLPKRYVARERLCLRGMTDYWVNDAVGKPFFVITASTTPGLLKMLESEIVPRLEAEVPNQPTAEELARDPYRSRFSLIFDREGFSPAFIAEMRERRIGCYTYRKYQAEDWPREEFVSTWLKMPGGGVVAMELAERGTLLGGQVWVREIRKLTMSGHQTALISTDFGPEMENIAAAMFSRWSQENFFAYMRQHFGIDRLLEYQTEPLPETTVVINPAYREIAGKIKSLAGKLARKNALFGGMLLEGQIDPLAMAAYETRKAQLQEEIMWLEEDAAELKRQRKKILRHIPYAELPPEQQFQTMANDKKHLVDTIKMIAYRAETAMADLIKPHMADREEARALLRQLYTSTVDLKPDNEAKTLTVVIHCMTNPRSDRVVRNLCGELNATETVYPGSELRLVYKMVSD